MGGFFSYSYCPGSHRIVGCGSVRLGGKMSAIVLAGKHRRDEKYVPMSWPPESARVLAASTGRWRVMVRNASAAPRQIEWFVYAIEPYGTPPDQRAITPRMIRAPWYWRVLMAAWTCVSAVLNKVGKKNAVPI